MNTNSACTRNTVLAVNTSL